MVCTAVFAVGLKKKYEKGASIRALAVATDRSYGFVHRILIRTTVMRRRVSTAYAAGRGIRSLVQRYCGVTLSGGTAGLGLPVLRCVRAVAR